MLTPVYRLTYNPRQRYLMQSRMQLCWCLQQAGIRFVLHYLDDYPPDSDECSRAVGILEHTCTMLGVPMVAEKKEGQTTTLVFLGILLDTVAGELWLLEQWRTKKVCRLKELETLIGLLNHACKVVRPSTQRTYGAAMRRFYAFCTHFNITSPFPVTEHLQCCFAAFLADQGLTPQTVKGYLAAVRNVQVSLGLPDPRDQSSLPMLK